MKGIYIFKGHRTLFSLCKERAKIENAFNFQWCFFRQYVKNFSINLSYFGVKRKKLNSNEQGKTTIKEMLHHNVRKGSIDLSKTLIASKSTEMRTLICYTLNNIRFFVLYASPIIKWEMITDVICIEKVSKTVLAGGFNLDFDMQVGEDFIKVLILWLPCKRANL